MRVLMVSLDRKVFVEGDPARARIAGLGSVFEALHIIVYAKKSLGLKDVQIAPNVWLYPTNSLNRYFYVSDAIRIAKRQLAVNGMLPTDIVSGQDLGETALAAAEIAHSFKLPLQLQDHADVFDPYFRKESLGNRLRVRLAKRMIRKANCLRVVLEAGKKRIVARYPELEPRITVLPVYTDTESLASREPVFSLHERYPEFKFIVLMATRLVPQKNLPFALEVIARVRASFPGIGLVLVGEGPQASMLAAKARSLGIEDHVVFVPWEKDLASYYQTADLFLLTSDYESYCRTLVEATACGLPFVSTDVGVASSLIGSGAHGTVLPHGDLEGFVNAIRYHVSENRERVLSRLGGNASVKDLVGVSEQEYRERYQASLEGCARTPAL